MRRNILLAAVTLVGLGTAPVMAGLLQDYFAGGGACFARSYDRAHLRSHPDQMVTDIHLGSTSGTADGGADMILDFGFTQRQGTNYAAEAYCRGTRCLIEGDGGNFSLSVDGDALKLSVGDFLAIEGAQDFSIDLAQSDDRVFLLYPAKASACR